MGFHFSAQMGVAVQSLMSNPSYAGTVYYPDVLIATAINLVRVVAWLTEPGPTRSRASPFAALVSFV